MYLRYKQKQNIFVHFSVFAHLSVLMAGGRVIGVEPQFFVEAEVQYDEITEVMSKLSLNQLSAPCIFYNLNGYYDSMKEMLSHMIKMGLSAKERQKDIKYQYTNERNCIYENQ